MSDIDLIRLAAWMVRAVPGFHSVDHLEKFPGGQSNPTYRVRSGGFDYVLRRKPFGDLLPSAHAVDREFRLLSALYPAGFPVPRPLALCEDPGVIGSIFYVMEHVEGRNFRDATLPELCRPDRQAYFEAMIDAQAALHLIDPQVVGLDRFGAPGNYIERQVQRWSKQYRASQTDDIPEMDRLIEWLPRTAPEQTRASIIHGDYRIDNLIYASDGPRVAAVLDWELATIGDPISDFAYLAMNWVMPRDWPAGLGEIDLEALGLPSLEEVIARYCGATGRDALPDLNWYFAFNLFRLAGIVQGIKKRVADGNASNSQAAAMAARVAPLAKLAWDQARRAGARR